MANYEIDPEILVPYLPRGTELDFFQGKTYVSLVGFMFIDTRIFGIPIPALGTFEEINLRFYVVRKVDNEIKRGVVFINETVPYRAVAWLANKLYKEHYTAVETKHEWNISAPSKQIAYYWKTNKRWNHLKVVASTEDGNMPVAGIEEFIFEHYYGFTRVSDRATEEYRVEHPRWFVHQVKHVDLSCDFNALYGKDFAFFSAVKPSSVMLAKGSAVSVKWKRKKLYF